MQVWSSEVEDFEQQQPVRWVVWYKVEFLVGEGHVNLVEEWRAGDDVEVVGERYHLRAAERDVLERNADEIVAELGCVVLLHYINIHMNEVVNVIQTHYTVTFEYDLLAVVVKAGRESNDCADVAEFLINLEGGSGRLCDRYLQSARIVVKG